MERLEFLLELDLMELGDFEGDFFLAPKLFGVFYVYYYFGLLIYDSILVEVFIFLDFPSSSVILL